MDLCSESDVPFVLLTKNVSSPLYLSKNNRKTEISASLSLSLYAQTSHCGSVEI